jgi:hypothetical protein
MMKQDQHNHSDDLPGNSFDGFLSNQLQQAQPYLEDDNFTMQVMERLPAAKKLSRWQERLIIIVPLIVISLLVLSQFSVIGMLVKLWTFLLAAQVSSLLQLGLFTTIVVISGASFWFAKQSKLI